MACQAGLFMILKFYFFEKFHSTVYENVDGNTSGNSTIANTTNTNSTLLYY